MSGARRLLAALAAAAVALAALTPAPATAATTPVSMVVAPQNGGILGAGGDLVVDVTVTNTSGAALPAGELDFSMDREPVASAQSLLAGIVAPPAVLLGLAIPSASARTTALAVGASQRIRARVDRDEVDGILSDADGTRVFYARYSADGLQRVVAEAAVTRMSGRARAVGFGTVVPITAPANTTGIVDTAAQQALTASGGAWDGALRAAQAMRSATIALDPEVIASIRLAGDAAPASATRFLEDLRALPNPVVELPYADGDLTLQRAAGATAPLTPGAGTFTGSSAITTPDQQGSASPTPAATAATGATATTAELTQWDWSPLDVAWPVPGSTDAGALGALGDDGRWVLLGSGDVTDAGAAQSAAGPRARIGDVGVIVADATASTLLARAAAGGATGDAALALLAGVLATDAVTGDAAAVLAVPSRTAAAGALPRVLDLLAAQPWIDGRSLPDLTTGAQGSPTVGLRGGSVQAARAQAARPLVEAESAVRSLGEGIEQPGAVVGPQRLALLALLSAAWRADDDGWRAAAPATAGSMRAVLGLVRITPGGPVTALGSDSGVQVSLVNGLSEPVRVRVHGTASNNRLRFTDADATVLLPAGAGGQAKLSARTITNGSVTISLQLRTADGVALGAPVDRVVSVRAGFDTVVAVLLLIALGGLLALGVYRNVTRRTRKRA